MSDIPQTLKPEKITINASAIIPTIKTIIYQYTKL